MLSISPIYHARPFGQWKHWAVLQVFQMQHAARELTHLHALLTHQLSREPRSFSPLPAGGERIAVIACFVSLPGLLISQAWIQVAHPPFVGYITLH